MQTTAIKCRDEQDDKVQLLFQGNAHSDFNHLWQRPISTDKRIIKELGSRCCVRGLPAVFDDPELRAIKVTTVDAIIGITKHGNTIAF